MLKDNDKRRINDITPYLNLFIKVYEPMQVYNRKEFGKTIIGNLIAKIKTEEKEYILKFKIDIGSSRIDFKLI